MSKVFSIIMFQGPLTLSVGKYRFERGKAVKSGDLALVEELKYHPNFKVEEAPALVAPKAPPAAAPKEGTVAKAASAVKKALTPKPADKSSAES